jgi:cytochrome oxidase assembly protein ShyY1
VRLKGFFDHKKEHLITRTVKNERGVEVVCPLFTGVDEESGNLQGILVNRGRLPYEYKDLDLHHTDPGKEVTVEGVIMYSEGQDRGVDLVKGTPTEENSLVT